MALTVKGAVVSIICKETFPSLYLVDFERLVAILHHGGPVGDEDDGLVVLGEDVLQEVFLHYKNISLMLARGSGAWFKNTLFVAAA